MAAQLATVRAQVESALAGRIVAPFTYRDRRDFETVPAGIAAIDSLTGGLPRGGVTEIFGPPCSGRTSVLISALASRTAHAESCALVDGRDSFDPHSAAMAGVRLKNLLWVRCRKIEHALRATDLLLQSGGFGMVALDLSDLTPRLVRHVPLNTWFRFRRAIENTPTVLLLLEQESNAKTCASLVLRLGAGAIRWNIAAASSPVMHARLLGGISARAKVVRSRVKLASVVPFARGIATEERKERGTIFELMARWDYPEGVFEGLQKR
jgi:recombination protein RecA